MSRVPSLLLVAMILGAAACGTSGDRAFSYPAIAVGQAALPLDLADYTLQLDRAQLAYGPAYFCRTAAASPELCPVAGAELLTVTSIDLLDPSPQPLGEIDSLPGLLRTTTYDLGWSWFPRDTAPRRAAGLDHSAEFALTLTRRSDGVVRTFVLQLDLLPTIAGTRTIGATRIAATVLDAAHRMRVTADARAWWGEIDPAELFELPAPADGPTSIPPDSHIAAILHQQITSGRPLAFSWELAP